MMHAKRVKNRIFVSIVLAVVMLLAAVLTVILVAPMKVSAAASTPQYITSIAVSQAGSASSAKSKLTNNGYTVYGVDLNVDAGGDYVYLGYKTSTDYSKAITGIVFRLGSSPPSSLTYAGSTFYLIGGSYESNGSGQGAVDLNAKAGGKYIYAYITRDTSFGAPMVDFEITTTTAAPAEGYTMARNNSGGTQDLNQGAGGKYLYLHYKGFSEEVAASLFYINSSGSPTVANYTGTVHNHNEGVPNKPSIPSTVTYDGYTLTLVGFRHDSRAEGPVTSSANSTYMIPTVYAVYTTTVTLTYSANGGTGAPPKDTATQYITAASTSGVNRQVIYFPISGIKPTHSGKCSFIGWAMSSGAWNASWTTQIATQKNITAYAVYYTNHTDSNSDSICDRCQRSLDASTAINGIYQISNAAELYWFASYVNAGNTTASAVVIADIDASASVYKNLCIGTQTNPYKGDFDGGGHTIKLALEGDGNSDDTALFEFIGGATIHDLHTTGTISAPYSSLGHNQFAAGIVSRVYSGTNSIERVTSDMIITSGVDGDGTHGGLVGVVEGDASLTLNNCGFSGAIDSSATNTSEKTNACGGLVGWTHSTSLVITNCYQAGTFDLEDSSNATICRSYDHILPYVTITNVYYLNAIGTVQGTAKSATAFTSGEVAYLLQGSQTAQVWGQNIDNGSTRENYPAISSARVYTYKDCWGKDIYSNTKTDSGHSFNSNGFCISCSHYQPATFVTTENSGGLGLSSSYAEYYAIGNAGQLYWFAAMVNSGYEDYYNGVEQNPAADGVLTANITDNSAVLVNGALNTSSTVVADFRSWKPIGDNSTSSSTYKGTFDGNGKTVSGLYFNSSSTDYVGLFGYTASSAVIKNVGVTDSYFNGNKYVGAVVGWSKGTITNCYNTGSVNGAYRVGGVAGYNGSSMTHCYNTGTIIGGTGEGFGGVAGTNDGTIANCYNTGSVSASGSYVGGIVGGLWQNSIANCYNIGSVSGSGSYVGGAVGSQNSSTTVTNCYYLDDREFALVGIGSEETDGAHAKTTAQFSSGEVAYLLQVGQSTQVWGQNVDNGAPLEVYPVFTNAAVHAKLACDEETITGYSNTSGITDTHVYGYDAPAYTWAEDHSSLTVTLFCEKFTEHTLSGTTTDITVNTTDPEWTVYTATVVLDNTDYTNTAEVENEIISVYITWTELTFVYTIEWNPETLQYEGAWAPETEGGGVITVTNEGNVDMDVSFKYSPVETTVNGSLTDAENATAITEPVSLDKDGGTARIKITLYGEPSEAFESAPVGSVTVTVYRTDTASLSAGP